MILICMVSFTAGETTTKLEQKQKTEIVKGFITEINAVSVDNYFRVVCVRTENSDVGWRNSILNYNLNSKSNLPGINRIPITSNFCNNERVNIRCDC